MMFEKSGLSLLNEQLFGNEITQKAQSIASQFFIKQFTLFLHLPRKEMFWPVSIEFLFEVWILKWSILKKTAVFAVSSWRDNEDKSYLVSTDIYFFWNSVMDLIYKLPNEKRQTKFSHRHQTWCPNLKYSRLFIWNKLNCLYKKQFLRTFASLHINCCDFGMPKT